MSIVARLMVALGAFSLVSAVAIALVFTVFMEDLTTEAQHRHLHGLLDTLRQELNAEGEKALALATLVAQTPATQAALAEGDRDALLAQYQGAFAHLRDTFGVRQFQFHRPPATSFLRVHKPETFGDDLSSFRRTVVQANTDRTPIHGLELGVAGLGMRGVTPVEYNGQPVGSVEVGLSFGPAFFDTFARDHGVDVALYLRKPGGRWDTFAATSEAPADEGRLRAALQDGIQVYQAQGADHEEAVIAAPIPDYEGKTIGVAVIALDSSPYLAQIADARARAVIASLVTLAVALMAGFVIARGIGGTLRLASDALSRFAQKDFSVDLPKARGHGETARVIQALHDFRAQTLKLHETENEQAAYLERVNAQRDDLERQSRKVLRGVVAATVEANEAIVALIHMMRDVDVATEQSQAMASAVEEMVAATREISESSDNAASEAEGARGAAGDGVSGATRAVDTMEGIHSAVSAASQRVDILADASSQIGDIVRQIEEIADQTNLLALNATIEAARAGDAGKGFAVVANQVKSLANQTARATEDIRGRIDTLRDEMASIIHAMENGASAVQDGRGVVTDMGTQLQTIASSISTVTTRMHDIASILGQQTKATNEIAEGTTSIASLSQRNSDEVKEALIAMERATTALNAHVAAFAGHGGPIVLVEIAKNDHIMFKKRVLDAVTGRVPLAERDLPDHLTCRLGRWYAQITDARLKAHPAFAALEAPHRQVHNCGKEAVHKASVGDGDGALEAMDCLQTASHDVIRLLTDMSTAIEAMEGAEREAVS
ncbi:methyl-accepting chemotaxis protein [Roseospira marina]|nr:cache domain-containing protein [Roseospira marina]MBB4312940.1 methyl-accepting chemotaxis protein [Roseospira marina]MBB5086287.1 methyl-accepting chemotaxis protein [Roseospira marina]